MRYQALLTTIDARCWSLLSSLAKSRVRAVLALIVVCICTYLPSQCGLPAVDRTEAAVAIASHSIVESGDLFAPTYDGRVQSRRPIGPFWVQALTAAGVSEEARNRIETYRLPSLIATTMAIALLYLLAAPWLGSATALMTALFVGVTPIVVLHAHLSIAEPLMLPMLIAAQMALLALYCGPPGRSRTTLKWALLFWVSLGISTWFNALAVPLLSLVTIIALACWDRSLALVNRIRPEIGLPLLAATMAPWLIAAAQMSGGTPFSGLGFGELLATIEGGQDMKFNTVHGVFIAMLVLGFLPVQHMFGPVLSAHWPQRTRPLHRFLLVWLIVPIVALEIFSNKPPLYTVQAVFPAGAALTAMAITGETGWRANGLKAWSALTWGAIVLLAILGPALLGAVLFATDTPLTAGHVLGYLVMAALLLTAGSAAGRGLMVGWFGLAVAGTIALNVWFNGLLMPGLRNFWTTPQLEQAVADLRACAPSASINVIGFREPSAVLALRGRATIESRNSSSEVTIVESRHQARFHETNPQAADLGCFRSFNIARGCSLRFAAYAQSATPELKSCKLRMRSVCAGVQNLKGSKALIKHCG